MDTRKTYQVSLQKLFSKGKGFFMFLLFFSTYSINANDYIKEINLDPINSFDEVPIEIIVKGYLRFEADAFITDTQAVYINVEELFKNLGIYCEVDNAGNILQGFIENESIRYSVDFNTKQIIRGDRIIKSLNGIAKELGTIYVETSVLNEAFGLNMIFNFRTLSIKLDANFELPMVKKARLEKMRENVSRLQSKNEEKIDTVIGREYHFFKGGALDWSFSSAQVEKEKTNNRFALGLGSELLYGEAKVAFNYYDQTKFDRRQLYYNWRWVDNDNNIIKQAQVGKIGSQTISFLRAPLVGASINNSPNTVRKAKGTYIISDYTEPNWTVELYINDALVDYTQSDASGFYLFKVPIVYGYTTLKLKFYGPLGEERVEEKVMNTPYTLMPSGVLEYNISGGVLEDGESSNFGRGEVNYGVNRFVTIGAGTEYLSSISNNPLIPFATIAFQPFSKMVINMEYAHNVSITGLLNYNFGRSAFLEIDYSKFVEGQEATLNRANEERKVRLSLPFKMSKISATTKLSFNQMVYEVFNFNQVDALFSTRYKNYSANASIASNWINEKDPFITSTLVLSSRTRNGFVIRPSLQYNITDNKMMRVRAEVEKRISKMSFSASIERNVQYRSNNLFFSFKYDLPFARTGFSSSYFNELLSFTETAQGSLAFGGGEVRAGYNSAIGKGGIICYPFLDLNRNGKYDKGEQKVLLNKVKVGGGKAIISKNDSLVRIYDLNAFINYNVEFSEADLDNISWRFPNKVYQILVDPNQYKKVYVPIHVVGEVSGTVKLYSEKGNSGQGRITLQIFDSKGTKVAETLSESDGYFSYLGLKPGNYTIKVDPEQLKKLNYKATPSVQTLTIKESNDGTIIDGISFVISNQEIIATKDEVTVEEIEKTELNEPAIEKTIETIEEVKEIKKETEENNIEVEENTPLPNENADPTFGRISDIKGSFYTVELGVYKEHQTKKQLFNLAPIFYEVLPNNTIRYVFGVFENYTNAVNAKSRTLFSNIKNATVIAYNNGEKVSLGELSSKIQVEKLNDTISKISSNKWRVDKNVNTYYPNIYDVKEQFYSVQIGAFNNFVTSNQLYNLSSIYFEVIPNGFVRYLYGKYNTLTEAKVGKNVANTKGIKDAFLVAYKNGVQLNAFTLKKIKTTDRGNFEIYGSVKVQTSNSIEGIKNINLVLVNKNGFMVGATSTDDEGNYFISNIAPGDYTIKLDLSAEDLKLYESNPLMRNIKISKENGLEELRGIDFIITNINK